MKQFKNDFISFANATYLLKASPFESGSYSFEYFIDHHEIEAVERLVKNQPDLNSKNINQIMDRISDNLIDHDYLTICDILSEFLIEYPQYSDNIDYYDIIDNFNIYGDISQYEQLIYNTYINVNIILNTHDDANMMYSNNSCKYIIDALQSENYNDYMDLISESSISFLLNSQGITEHMFYKYITSENVMSNRFMDSLYNELLNGYEYEAVTFFTEMPVSEYLKLKESRSFKIPKNIDCGLVGFINGSGSVLNIRLQSDIVLNHDQVIIEVDGGYNYGIMDIYGLVGYNEVAIDIIKEGYEN